MADTGWLKPLLSSIVSVGASGGNHWYRVQNFATNNNWAADSWGSHVGGYESSSEALGWDWLVPADLYPSNAVVTGIEVKVWAYSYLQAYNSTPVPACGIISLDVGSATITSSPADSAPQIFRVPDPGSFPDPALRPPSAGNLIEFGGPSDIFDLAAGTKVSDLFSQFGLIYGPTNRNSAIRVGIGPSGNISDETAFYLSYAEIKVHYDIPVVDIDLPYTEPETVVSATGDLQVIHKLAAIVVTDVLIEQAQLGGTTNMAAKPETNLGLPADLTNGLGFIDSTSLPTVVVSIPDVDLALLRFKDLSSSPEVVVDGTFWVPGKRIDMSSDPGVSVSLGHGLKSIVGSDAEPIVVVSLVANLSADTDMVADPKTYITLTANLQGDINLGSECSVAELTTVVSLIANLGYARGLYSNPNISVTLDGNGLTVGAALEFSPLVSVTIPFANLVSKFGEPAPDHRTIFKCPVDRTIRITRKDKTIL